MSGDWNRTEWMSNVVTAEAASSSPVYCLQQVTATAATKTELTNPITIISVLYAKNTVHTRTYGVFIAKDFCISLFFTSNTFLRLNYSRKSYHNCSKHKLTWASKSIESAHTYLIINRIQHFVGYIVHNTTNWSDSIEMKNSSANFFCNNRKNAAKKTTTKMM